MGARRTVLVGVVLAFAALAAGLTFVYLRGIERRAYDGARLVEVFTLSRDVPKGTPGETAIEAAIVRSRIPERFLPANAVRNLDELRGRVALTALSTNTILVDGQFVEPRAAQVTFSQRIPSGNVAITVAVDEVRGVAGLLVPGDRVDILTNDGEQQRVLFQNVLVIAIGTTAAPQPGEAAAVANPGSGLITFAVPPEAASRIAFASQSGGGLYLTLVPPDNQAQPVPPINRGNLYSGSLTP